MSHESAVGETPKRVFDALFESYYTVVRRYSERRLADVNVAEDIAAETFAVAWGRINANESVDLPWLYTVAARRIADHYRRKERWGGVEAALLRREQEPDASRAEPLDILALRDALRRLPEQQREAVLLHYWEGLPAGQIAMVLQTSEQAVWALLSRARKRLRRLLDVPGDTTTQTRQSGEEEHEQYA